MERLAPGTLFAERYSLLAEAGRGGMGVVYRAEDRQSGEIVALKVIEAEGAEEARRFLREAATLEALRHPGVVRYIDHGRSGGSFYLAMEWLEGETLASRQRRDPLSLEECLALAHRAAEALGAAHAAGIVHRDVTPANLFLERGDPERLRLLDFGIARSVERGATLTAKGTMLGTPFYMAPEQARAAGSVDPRADVYALGCVLYELLGGQPPFPHQSLMAVLAATLFEPPRPLRELRPEVDPELAALTMRLLAKDPGERPADGAALAKALAEHKRSASIAAASEPPRGALTGAEQRVVCLVLVAGMYITTRAGDRTLPTGSQAALEQDRRARVREAVEAHGGGAEVLADGSLVVRVPERGSPRDRAARAARCALAIRAILPEEAICVVAGRSLDRGRLPVGEAVQRGARMLEQTGARQAVRLDEPMAALLDERFVLEEQRHGVSLLGERGELETARVRLRGAPFVGRARELANLEALYEEVVEEPTARAALILGEAGLGKSRLLTELLARLAEREEAPLLLLARGDALSPGSPFGLIAQSLRQAAEIRQGEPLALRRRKLRDHLAAPLRRLDPRERGRTIALLGELLHTPFPEAELPSLAAARQDSKSRGDALRSAIGAWLEGLLLLGPAVFLWDDLHLGDLPSLRALDEALRQLHARPLLVLGAGRPELSEAFPHLFEERSVEILRLSPLRKRAAAELARAVAPQLDPGVIQQAIAHAEGHPYFLTELLRGLAFGGEQAPGEGLPTSVLAMIEARLSTLSPEARRALRAASVFGTRCWVGGLRALLGEGASWEPPLSDLLTQGLLREVEGGRFEEERELEIEQALLREAAYAMLTTEDRRLGHRLAARWLTEVGERDSLVRAEHARLGGLGAEAAALYAEAAHAGLAGDDLEAALRYAERGLSALGAEPAVRGALLSIRADALRWRGDYEAALEDARRALTLLPAGEEPSFRALGILFSALGQLGRASEAAPFREQARRSAAAAGAASARLICLCRAGALLLSEGDLKTFDLLLEEVEGDLGEAGEAPLARAWIATLKAARAAREGDLGAFVSGTEEAIRGYDAAGDARNRCNQEVRLGNGYVGLGRPEKAEPVLREALREAERMGLSLIRGYALQNLGNALLRLGRHEEARAAERDAIRLAQHLDDTLLRGGSLIYLADIALAQGRAEEAERHSRAAAITLSEVPPMRSIALATLALSLLAAGRGAEALTASAEAMELLRVHSLEEGDARVTLSRIESLRAAGGADSREQARLLAQEGAERIRGRAARILDPSWRRAYLLSVPEHSRLLALAHE